MNVFVIHQDGEHSVRQSSAPREVRARVCCWQVGHEGEAKMGRWCCVQKLLKGWIRHEGEDLHQSMTPWEVNFTECSWASTFSDGGIVSLLLGNVLVKYFLIFPGTLFWSILPIFLVSERLINFKEEIFVIMECNPANKTETNLQNSLFLFLPAKPRLI